MEDKSELLNQLRLERAQRPPPPGGARRPWLIAGALVLLLGAAAAYYALAARGVPVKVVTARALSSGSASAGSLLDASGYVVARREATVAAKITGKVTQVLIEEGQHVKAGQIVGRLDDTNVRAAYDQARAQLDYARAALQQVRVNLANAQRDYARKQDLFNEHFVSKADLDNAQTAQDELRAQLVTAQRSVDVAAAGVEVARRNLDDTVIRAPFSGVITVKAAQPGEIISPISAGGGFTRTGIGTIVDMDSLEVEVDVNENFINRVHPGQPVTVKLNAYPDWQIPAHVIAVVPTADRSKATVKVRVGLGVKDPRILPEMGVRVSFLDETQSGSRAGTPKRGALVAPEAVQADGRNGIVYVVHDGSVERREVKLGAKTPEGQIVLSGLAGGERLAVGDFGKLADGAKVRVLGPDASARGTQAAAGE
jgi:RND family efflux transporter MFP subunit